MKKLMLLGLLTACSTPAYVVQYECSKTSKEKLADVTNLCISSSKRQEKPEKAKDIIEGCREMALKNLCLPKDYFQYEIPFLGKRPAVTCDHAITFWEKYMCDGV